MIRLSGGAVRAGGFHLAGLELAVAEGAYAVLMGPTGCGKTTLLEALCGLNPLVAGKLELAGVDVTDATPAARGVGYVPQDGALFPHLTVAEHLGFALRIQRCPRDERAARVSALAARLGLEPLLARRPRGLSGGERQRVALGRALAARPRVLLLDEPLSAVDEALRGELELLLAELRVETGATVLHVTHSSAEARALATTLLRLENGRIEPAPLHA